MLHLELGFASLFSYCVGALGMSEGSAGRRVTAARVCRRFPQLFEGVARGDLHLCALCALAPHLSPGLRVEDATELFDACRGKTRRQVEELLAARFPRPDVREQIRRSADGRRCTARAFLEFDHIEPFARFGAPDTRNMRMLCKGHNLLHARRCFGALHIAAKVAARRQSDS